MKKWVKISISVAIPLLIGFISSFFTKEGIDNWYRQINTPRWNPPDYVFAPVWTTLYILMGLAFYFIWITPADKLQKKIAVIFYSIQLILNFLWSYMFFSLHEIGWAFAEIGVLWIFILLTIFSFAAISKKTAWLLVPYISWVSFAAILNYTIWTLNK